MLKSKPAGGGSAARAKVAMKSNKQLERQRSARRKQLHSSMQIGPKPAEASDFFMPHNKDLFNIPMDHVISCKMPPYKAADLGKKELKQGTAIRDKRDDKLFYINAGTPKKGRPDAGLAFHGHPWVKEGDDDAYIPVDWDFELSDTQRMGTRWSDPVGPDEKPDPYKVPVFDNGDYTVNETAHNTKADFLARCMGHKALCTPSTEAFKTFVLGVPTDFKTGGSMQAIKEVNPEEWERQRNAMFNSLGKIYMVYPKPVDPVFDEHGRVFAKGEIASAPNAPKPLTIVHEVEDKDPVTFVPGMEVNEFEHVYAPQPVLFCSFTPDTTSREATCFGQRVLSGPHDTTRAWPLLPSHVAVVRKLLKYYELEADFPALANLHESRDGAMLNLEHHRDQGMHRLGLPSGEDHEPIPREWLNKVANLPFGKVWVQKCTRECPDGMTEFGTDRPMLVPLLKGRAEEKNGIPWIDSRKLEEDKTLEGTLRYVGVMKALHRILGKEWDKSGTKRKAAHGFAALSAQRDEMREDDEEGKGKKARKMSKSKDMDDVIAAQYAAKSGDAGDGKSGTSTALVNRAAEMEAIASNRFVYNAAMQGRGRLTFPEDCANGAVRVQWPHCGNIMITLGKRGHDGFQEFHVPPGTAFSFTYCKDADSDDDSENDI